MNIRAKTLAVVASALLVSVAGNWAVLHELTYPAFAELEKTSAIQGNRQVLEAIDSEIDSIDVTLWDYSNWDDAFEFARGANPHFPDGNLNKENLSKFSIDFLEAYSQDGTLIFSALIDDSKPKPQDRLVALYPHILEDLKAGNLAETKGLVATPQGPVMFAARPVLKTDGGGPPTGHFVFARYLDEEVEDHIRHKTNIAFDLLPVPLPAELGEAPGLQKLMRSGDPLVVKDTDDNRLLTYSVLQDFGRQPILVLKSLKSRDITAIGRRVLLASMAGITLSGLLVMGATTLLLQWLLIGPLVRFTQQVVTIGRSGKPGQDIALDREDEIGTLSREFGKMLDRLAEAREQSLERSYHTGLAEMAAGVLHNLRNHMTPLSMRVSRLRENLSNAPGTRLCKAFDELMQGDADGERREKLRAYVQLSLRDIPARNARIAQWLERVSDDLRRLDDALSELQRFGPASTHMTPVLVNKVLQETMAQLPDYSHLSIKIDITPRLDSTLSVLSTPFILKHILHNLLVNACEAIVAARRPGEIEIVQVMRSIDGREMVELQVRDNGIGIAPELLTTVFSRGFTTKIGERRGTGLHWCANSAAKLGGELRASSPGIDRGAVFHLLLPLVVTDMPAAA